MRRASLWFLALGIAVGCSVPATRFGNRVSEITKKLAEAEAALAKEELSTALSRAIEITKLGSALAGEGKILLGDPRRKKVDKALERAREIRDEVRRQRERQTGVSERRIVESAARTAFMEGAASTVVVKGPPGGAVRARADAPAVSAAGGDEDLERHRKLAFGDRKGDVAAEPEKPKRKKLGKGEVPEKLKVDESTPPIIIRKRPVTKGKGVVLYFTFVNKHGATQIGSVTGEFLRENGKVAAPIISTFKAETFRPDWDSIFDSKGDAVTAGSVGMAQMDAVHLASICEKPAVGEVTSARIVVTTLDGRTTRGKGPPE